MISSKRKNVLISMCECALMVALAVILDLVLRLASWPNGGSVSACAIPILFFSYRRGWRWGLCAGFVLSGIQMLLGFWAPPARTLLAFVGVILLDYVVAFSVLGLGELFAKCFRNRLVGYGFGAFAVSFLRFLCSFFSGILIWPVPEGVDMPLALYSFTYNGGYMLPNAIISVVAILILCAVIDPKTLRKPQKSGTDKEKQA